MFKAIPRGIVYHSISYDIKNLVRSLFTKRTKGNILRLEQVFSEYMDAKGAVAFSFARTAIYVALKVKSYPVGSEIIMPPITIKPILDVVLGLGLKVVFVDLDQETLCFDCDKLEKAITKKTKAINITYLYGIVPDLDQILFLCRKNNLFVIEDFSHNLNAEYKGKKLGTFGDVGVYSASSVKTFDIYGAGLLVSDDEELLDSIKKFQGQLKHPPRFFLFNKVKTDLIRNVLTSRWPFVLFTFPLIKALKYINREKVLKFLGNRKQEPIYKIPKEWLYACDSLQGIIGIEILPTVTRHDEERKKNVHKIKKELIKRRVRMKFPTECKDSKCTFWQFVFYPDNSIKIQNLMHTCGVDTATTSLSLISQMNKYSCCSSTPNAENIHNNALFIPAYPSLREKDIKKIADALIYIYKENGTI